MVADFGFKKNYRGQYFDEQADFVTGTRIGFKKIRNESELGSLDVYKTIDGGITWNQFAYFNYPNYFLYVAPSAIYNETVYFQGWHIRWQYPDSIGVFPLMKIKKHNQIDSIFPKVEIGGITYSEILLQNIHFLDSVYGLVVLGPSAVANKYFILRTTNGGRNFNILDSTHYNSLSGELIAINKKTLLIRGGYNLSISTDSGLTWKLITKVKIVNSKTDTLITGAAYINGDIFYLKENKLYNSSNPTISILYHKKLTDSFFDSIIIKPTEHIECYDNNRCYMYGQTFYQNFNPITYPLSEKEIIKKQDEKPKLIYYADQIELLLPSSEQNNQFQLMLFDMSGKLIFTDNIPNQSANYKLRLTDSLPQGLYILRLCDNKKVFCLKFLR
jgi:hypothetical protein